MLSVSIVQRAKQVLAIAPGTFKKLLVFSITVSVLSLIVPVVAQSLMNFIAFGNLLQPVIVLCVIVLIVMSASACLRIYHVRVVEWIQRRLFVHISLDLAKRLPESKLTVLERHRHIELINYFLEIPAIQKAVATLLISGLELILRTFFGMVLLASYHPMLMMFDIVMVSAFCIAIGFPFRAALRGSMQECSAKHEVAAWLETLMRKVIFFKQQQRTNYALQQADNKVMQYLEAREGHFSQILHHLYGIYSIAIIASVVLLALGAWLVIREQLSLGQLVASEIILATMVSNFIVLGGYLSDLYDGLASSDKMYQLLHLPTEKKANYTDDQYHELVQLFSHAFMIECRDLCYRDVFGHEVVRQLSFDLQSGKSLALVDATKISIDPIVDLLMGVNQADTGLLKFNDVVIEESLWPVVRAHIAIIDGVDLLGGSLLDNLLLHHQEKLSCLHELLNDFAFDHVVARLSHGLDTDIAEVEAMLSIAELCVICLIRALLGDPQLMIISHVFDKLSEHDLKVIHGQLQRLPQEFTLLVLTKKPLIADYFDEKIVL